MIRNLLIWAITLTFILNWSDEIYYQIQNIQKNIEPHLPEVIPKQNERFSTEEAPSRLMLKADENGHFKGTILINAVAMPFIIDTGATNTMIPAGMANKAKLPKGKTYQTETANGLAANTTTVINSLKIGNIEIRNIEAGVTQKLTEVLIGMNTLRLFSMSIEGDKMILVANSNLNGINGINIIRTDLNTYKPLPDIQPEKIIKNWKKSVICNSEGNCKTIYGY